LFVFEFQLYVIVIVNRGKSRSGKVYLFLDQDRDHHQIKWFVATETVISSKNFTTIRQQLFESSAKLLQYSAVVKIPLKLSWIRILIRLTAKI